MFYVCSSCKTRVVLQFSLGVEIIDVLKLHGRGSKIKVLVNHLIAKQYYRKFYQYFFTLLRRKIVAKMM